MLFTFNISEFKLQKSLNLFKLKNKCPIQIQRLNQLDQDTFPQSIHKIFEFTIKQSTFLFVVSDFYFQLVDC